MYFSGMATHEPLKLELIVCLCTNAYRTLCSFFNHDHADEDCIHWCVPGCCKSDADFRQKATARCNTVCGFPPDQPLLYRWKGFEQASSWALRGCRQHGLLPRTLARQFPDKQVQQALQMLLARLAVHGICLHMCEHYTPRQAYCLLTEQILKEENVYPDLPNTRCVQHFMTAEDCELCQAEFEAQTDGPLSEDEE